MGGKSLVNYGVRPNRDILFLNTSNQVCPAYSPISFCWDNEADFPSPWVEGTTLLEGGQLALPASFSCMSETGQALTMYAINGPLDVQPNCYGTASISYPLPIRYDPNSFPIPIDPEDPLGTGFEPGTWDEYITAYPGDIEGPPLLGLFPFGQNSVGEESDPFEYWQPASFFNAPLTLWSVVFWMPNADASMSENLALVVPSTGVGQVPYGGAIAAYTGEEGPGPVEAEANVPIELLQPEESFTLLQAGLYRLAFNGSVGIQYAGVAATVNVWVTFGPNWANLAETSQADTFSQTPVPGETISILNGGRQNPIIELTSNNDFSLVAGSGNDTLPVSGSLGTFFATYNYLSFGYESLSMEGYFYFLPGDVLTVSVVTSGNQEDGSPVTITVNGSLSYLKLTTNSFGTFGIFY
jgi:hypothetical protein